MRVLSSFPSRTVALLLAVAVCDPVWGAESGDLSRRNFLKAAGCASVVAAGTVGWLAVGEHRSSNADHRRTDGFDDTPPSQRLDIFVVGDSLSCGEFSYGNSLTTILSARMRRQQGWALSVRETEPALQPLFDRMAGSHETQVTVAASPGAYVDKASPLNRDAANLVARISNLSDQVDRLISQPEPPNLILIWIGHNNADWVYDLQNVEGLNQEAHLTNIPRLMADGLEHELDRIRKHLSTQEHPAAVVVYGLANFENGHKARIEAAEIRAGDPSRFPFFEVPNKRFPSILPKHIATTIDLGIRINQSLEKRVEEFQDRWGSDERWFRYSSALFDAPLDKVEMLHASDGFHLSQKGHNAVAEAVELDLKQVIDFLGL